MTFFLMVVIGFALLLKIVLGAIYSLGYRCTHKISVTKKIQVENIKNDSKVEQHFKNVKGSMVD